MINCELTECRSGLKGDVIVNDNIGDGAWSTLICSECATVIGLREGSDIPDDTAAVNKQLREHYKGDSPT